MDSMTTPDSSARTRLRSERGAELIEFALVLPLLLLLIAGTVDLAFLFHSMEVTTNAAREGARLATLPGYEKNGWQPVKDRITDYLRAGGLDVSQHTSVVSDITIPIGALSAQGVEVKVTYTHNYYLLKPISTLVGGTFKDFNTHTVMSRMRKELQAGANP
jgi:hypothetical protein